MHMYVYAFSYAYVYTQSLRLHAQTIIPSKKTIALNDTSKKYTIKTLILACWWKINNK